MPRLSFGFPSRLRWLPNLRLGDLSPISQELKKYAHVLFLLAFWLIGLSYLDRLPVLNEAEAWILAPGYKLVTRGIFGVDMLAGFYGMEMHYFEFMPLMSVLEGIGAVFWGLGVFQMRFLPLALG